MKKSEIKIFTTLIVAIFLVSSAYAATLCSYKGPSPDAPDNLQLSDFLVSGDSPVSVGDFARVSFSIRNVDQQQMPIKLAEYGILVRAKSPSGDVRIFGYSYKNYELKPGEKISLASGGGYLNEEGTWIIWPSYHIKLPTGGAKYGPDEWHACVIKVAPKAPPSLPDLTIAEIKCDKENSRIGYVLKNSGEGIAKGGHSVTLYVDDEEVSHDLVDADLEPGETYESWFREYKWAESEDIRVKICADNYKQVEESNEQNNSMGEKIAPISKELPDLVITDILCDEEEGRIGYEIKNVGDRVAPAGHKTALLIEAQTVDEDEVDVSLDPGDTYQGYFESYELASTVVITICADHYDVVAEASEDNNCLRGECVLEEEEPSPTETELLPDLIVDYYSPLSYSPGTKEFYYTILNRGDASAPSTVTEVYIDGIKVAEQIVGALEAHDKREEVIPYDYSDCPICTEHRIEFRLDARNEVIEESEYNNNRFKDITCSYLFLPDINLAVEDIRVDAMHRIGFTISNLESGESPETEARLWIDNHLVESIHIAPLAGGHSRVEYFDHRWQCEGYEDNIKVWVEPVVRRVEDCDSGIELGLGELDYTNNWAEATWECIWPDLVIEIPSSYFHSHLANITYTITNQGRSRAGSSITKLYCSSLGSAVASDRVPALDPGDSWEGSFPRPVSDYCSLPSDGFATVYVKADGDDAVTELDEMNNWEQVCIFCGFDVTPGKADLSVERIWFEGTSTTPCSEPCRVCFEIKNVGGVSGEAFVGKDTTVTKVEIHCRSCSSRYGTSIYERRTEPDLGPRESRTVCYDLSTFGNWCGCKKLFVDVNVDDAWDLRSSWSPSENDHMSAELENRCANGIQDQGEEGIDCGGPCPASCRDCFDDADFGHAENAGYFCLGAPGAVVLNTATQALEEYANCLSRDIPPGCRATLEVTDPLMDFSTITVADLEQNTDYIMEAVAYYVDQHTTYMYDDGCDICDSGGGFCGDPSGAINAEDMILLSSGRSGTISVGGVEQHVDTCPDGDYCGDCEDHAILREALMRSLGVSWRCAFCADHYDGYQGGGHTFNLVYYRNKWRIMDYGPLGRYFSIDQYWDAHNPNNVWNDRVGEYWCPGWRDNWWNCCNNHNPYSETQNYNGGEECCPGDDYSYYEECAP